VLIDEATQAVVEAEALIPDCHGAPSRLSRGDHCQLGPVVMRARQLHSWLPQSMFERLVVLVTTVRFVRMHQYRSNLPLSAEFLQHVFNRVSSSVAENGRQLQYTRFTGKEDFSVARSEQTHVLFIPFLVFGKNAHLNVSTNQSKYVEAGLQFCCGWV
jgi:hypothetical protein